MVEVYNPHNQVYSLLTCFPRKKKKPIPFIPSQKFYTPLSFQISTSVSRQTAILVKMGELVRTLMAAFGVHVPVGLLENVANAVSPDQRYFF